MVRKSSKTTELAMNALDEMINTSVNFQFDKTAQKLGIGEAELRERLESKLNSADVHTWDTIPVEHQPIIDQIARDLDAERSTRKLEPQAEIPQLPEATEQPIEPQPTRRRGRTRRESTALTETKSAKLKESDKSSQRLATSDQEVKVTLHARKGQKSGAQLATIELAAEDATYRQIKGQALVRKVGQLTSEIASETDFDPIQVLKDLGIDSNSEIFEDLRDQIEPALGKIQTATGEIVDNAWLNGVDLEVELGNLESLMNCSGSTSDYWQ